MKRFFGFGIRVAYTGYDDDDLLPGEMSPNHTLVFGVKRKVGFGVTVKAWLPVVSVTRNECVRMRGLYQPIM